MFCSLPEVFCHLSALKRSVPVILMLWLGTVNVLHAHPETTTIELSTETPETFASARRVTIQARMDPAPSDGVWRECQLLQSGGTAVANTDYTVADRSFKFNRNNGWSTDTHIQVLAGATAGRTLALEASCSDRSDAAAHLVPDPLTSNTVTLTLVTPVITLSVDTTEVLLGTGTVDIQAHLTPAPGGGIWRDCHLRTIGGTAVAGTDYNLATESFKFNTLNNWATKTHITLLDDATASSTIELQAYCNDRSAAAVTVASVVLDSNSLSLTLTGTASSADLTCEEILTIAQSHLSTTAHEALSNLSATDCEKGAQGMTREEVEYYFRNAEYAPDHDHDEIEVRIWPTMECLDEAYIAAHGPCPYRISGQSRTSTSDYPSGPQRPHPALKSEDTDIQDTESQDQTRHYNEAIYRHEWHTAGEEPDHLQVYVALEHHSDHYHSYCGTGAEDCSLAHIIEVTGNHHQYRDIHLAGDLFDELVVHFAESAWRKYRLEIDYEYRHCLWPGLCWAQWHREDDSTVCLAANHEYGGTHCHRHP